MTEFNMTRPLLLAAYSCLILIGFNTASLAQVADTSSENAQQLKGNPEAGKQLFYTCQGCHSVTGYKNAYPSYHVPRIVGQSSEYLSQALIEYKTGKRKHLTMHAQTQNFSDQDIADLAVYLSGLK